MSRALLLLAALGVGCTPSDAEARRTLDAYGFTDVELTGYSWMGCGDDDSTSTGFTAVNAKGDAVQGVVCCGFLTKACTVRF